VHHCSLHPRSWEQQDEVSGILRILLQISGTPTINVLPLNQGPRTSYYWFSENFFSMEWCWRQSLVLWEELAFKFKLTEKDSSNFALAGEPTSDSLWLLALSIPLRAIPSWSPSESNRSFDISGTIANVSSLLPKATKDCKNHLILILRTLLLEACESEAVQFHLNTLILSMKHDHELKEPNLADMPILWRSLKQLELEDFLSGADEKHHSFGVSFRVIQYHGAPRTH